MSRYGAVSAEQQAAELATFLRRHPLRRIVPDGTGGWVDEGGAPAPPAPCPQCGAVRTCAECRASIEDTVARHHARTPRDQLSLRLVRPEGGR